MAVSADGAAGQFRNNPPVNSITAPLLPSSTDGNEKGCLSISDGDTWSRPLVRPRTRGRVKCSDVTLELLQSLFRVPINEAAAHLGVGVTVMKKYCRRVGIKRWPYRKLTSMTNIIAGITQMGEADNTGVAQDALEQLHAELRSLQEEPSRDMEVRTKKLRQAIFKEKYKLNHAD